MVLTNVERNLLRAEEVAEFLGIGRSKVFDLFRARELPVIRIGRSVRVPRAALQAWIEERTEHPNPTTRGWPDVPRW